MVKLEDSAVCCVVPCQGFRNLTVGVFEKEKNSAHSLHQGSSGQESGSTWSTAGPAQVKAVAKSGLPDKYPIKQLLYCIVFPFSFV